MLELEAREEDFQLTREFMQANKGQLLQWDTLITKDQELGAKEIVRNGSASVAPSIRQALYRTKDPDRLARTVVNAPVRGQRGTPDILINSGLSAASRLPSRTHEAHKSVELCVVETNTNALAGLPLI